MCFFKTLILFFVCVSDIKFNIKLITSIEFHFENEINSIEDYIEET